MLVYFLVVYLQTIDRLLILAIFLVYSGLLGLMVYYLEYPETFRGCQIHFRKIQLDKGRVVVLSFLFYRVFLCGVRVIFS